ncbi:LANO_0H01530g1_1 [Lachancea nothofagi CBS 11611]|uniref:LANO_0H01530g1_1 n=1 Tax=Lachancea nothofagi CBS 11611 TaxID=1266666 RepID=A0A1G4KKV0_9SACH|nr:LANO_0H01530g1_1 [Lachancea nothofagi CBS 11611]
MYECKDFETEKAGPHCLRRPDYTTAKYEMSSKLKAWQIETVKQLDVDQLYYELLYWAKRSGVMAEPDRKKLKGEGCVNDSMVEIIKTNLSNYASNLLHQFERSSHHDSANFESFHKFDLLYQRTYAKFAPLFRLAEEAERQTVYADESLSNSTQSAKFAFLKLFFHRKGLYLSSMLEYCWDRARAHSGFLDEARVLTRRVQEVQALFPHPQGLSVEAIYAKSLNRYVEALTIPIIGYLTKLSEIITVELRILEYLSLEVRENARIAILERTLMGKEVMRQLVEFMAADYCACRSDIKGELEQLYQISQAANYGDVFMTALIDAMYSVLENAFSQKSELVALPSLLKHHEDILDHLFLDASFKHKFEHKRKTLLDSESRVGRISSKLAKCIDKFQRNCRKPDAGVSITKMAQSIVRTVVFYKMHNDFIPAFIKLSLLRSAIRQGHQFLYRLFEHKRFGLERELCDLLILQNLPDSRRLQEIMDSLHTSFVMQDGNKNISFNIEPIILSEKEAKLLYKPKAEESALLPKELQKLWDSQSKHFESLESSAKVGKKLTLMPMLNTIQMSTPMLLSGRRSLMLEMNLLQAAVLEAFNYKDTLSFTELRTNLETTDDQLLRVTLNSFIRVDLLTNCQDVFSVNYSFQPRKNQLQGNCMRINFNGRTDL